MSTYAPARAVQSLDARFWTVMVSVSGTPARAVPVEGSVRISERKSFSSTQYGPSVMVGVDATHVMVSAASTVSFQAGMKYPAAPAPARVANTRRREIELTSFIYEFPFS